MAKIASDIPLSDSSSPSTTERKNGKAVKMNPIWSLSIRLNIPGTRSSGFSRAIMKLCPKVGRVLTMGGSLNATNAITRTTAFRPTAA